MSSFTAAGKPRKSRLDDPTQCSYFSSAARTGRTLTSIPVLGYSRKGERVGGREDGDAWVRGNEREMCAAVRET